MKKVMLFLAVAALAVSVNAQTSTTAKPADKKMDSKSTAKPADKKMDSKSTAKPAAKSTAKPAAAPATK